MFTPLVQPRIGEYLAPGLPMSISGVYPPAVAAPALGDHTVAVLRERLGLSSQEIDRLTESATVATSSIDELPG